MRKLLSLIAVVGMVTAVGCKKDEDKKDGPAKDTSEEAKPDDKPTEVKPADTKPADTKPEDAKPEEPGMANKMEHCPASVPGSKTTVADGDGVVIVTTTATEAAATEDIRKRSAYLVGLNDADMSKVKHSGNGTGGGHQGLCPVAVGLASLASEEVEGGTKITMTPRKDDGFAQLSSAVKKRAMGMAASSKAAGDHKGGGTHHGDGTGAGKGNGGGSGQGKEAPSDLKDPFKDGKKGKGEKKSKGKGEVKNPFKETAKPKRRRHRDAGV